MAWKCKRTGKSPYLDCIFWKREKIIDSMTVDMLINESIYEFEAVDIRKEKSADEKMDFNQIMDKQEKKLIAFALEK